MTDLLPTAADPGTTVRLTVRPTPAGVTGRGPLRLDWSVTSGTAGRQVGYNPGRADPGLRGRDRSTGPVAGADQLDVIAPGGPLRSREVRHLRVRVATDAGWSGWSAPATVEAGLLAPADWQAVAVTLPDDPGAREQAPVPLLRKAFELPAAPRRARLYVISLGMHEVSLNGERVGDDLLEPGWTADRQRLLVTGHDVADLLPQARTCSAAGSATGGTAAVWAGTRRRIAAGTAGSRPAGPARGRDAGRGHGHRGHRRDLARRDRRGRAPTSTTVARSTCGTGGPAGSAPGSTTRGWAPAAVVPLDPAILQPRVAPPVRVRADIPVRTLGRGPAARSASTPARTSPASSG